MRSRYSSSHTRIWPCIFSNEKPRQRIYSNQQWNQVWFLHCTFCYKGASQLRSYMYLQCAHVGFWAMSSVKVHCNKGAHSHVQGPTWQELNPISPIFVCCPIPTDWLPPTGCTLYSVEEHCSSCLEQQDHKVAISIKNWSPCANLYKTGQHSHFPIILQCITYLTIRYDIMGQRGGKLVPTAYKRYTY